MRVGGSCDTLSYGGLAGCYSGRERILGITKKGGGESSPPPFRLGQQSLATYFLNLKLHEGWQLELYEGQ